MNCVTLKNTQQHTSFIIGKDEVMGSSPIISSSKNPGSA